MTVICYEDQDPKQYILKTLFAFYWYFFIFGLEWYYQPCSDVAVVGFEHNILASEVLPTTPLLSFEFFLGSFALS